MFLPVRTKGPEPRAVLSGALGEAGRAAAESVLKVIPGYGPTPLVDLPGLANATGVAAIHLKDEGKRFGLGSFKALGGAYAILTLVLAQASQQLGRPVTAGELDRPEVRAIASGMTFCCATDGNHGRSVAWGAQLAGAGCEIFIHAGVSPGREQAMAAFGARMNRIAGNYDDSVALAAQRADENGWTVVSDTAWPGYETIPLTVMQGYTTMIGEALDALGQPPTHIFLQAGVGGMAAAVAGYASQRLGDAAPKIIVVEPARAACLFETAKAGRMLTLPHGEPTVMAMLECATPSPLGWEVLQNLADGYVTLEEDESPRAMRLLANPLSGDPAVVSGESGCTGLAGLLACMANDEAKAALSLGPDSRILVFNSEGATDPAIYRQIVGKAPNEVAP